MKAEIKRLFEMLTRQFLKDFLPNCTQNARGLNEDGLDRLLGIPKFSLIGRNSCSFPLFPAYCLLSTASSQVSPILHTNHPILRGNHPILLSNHPI